MVTGYLWLHGFVPIATAIHIVSRLVRSMPRRSELFITLKGHFLSSYRREVGCLFGSCFSQGKKTAIFHLKINQKLRAKQVYCDSVMPRGINSLSAFRLCCSGKTEYQATHAGRLRRASTFERRPSKRYPSRTQSLGKGEPDVVGSQQNLWFLMCLHPTSQMLMGKTDRPTQEKKGKL